MAEATAVAPQTKTLNAAELSKEVRELHAADAKVMDRLDEVSAEARAAANQTGAVVAPEPTVERKDGTMRLSAFQWTAHKVKQGGNITVKTRHLVEIGAFIGAWRGAARLLESRVTLPVSIYADIIAGTVGLVICEGVIMWRARPARA